MMAWRRPLYSAVSIAVAVLCWWMAPGLLAAAGLMEFDFVGRICSIVLALSALDWVMGKLASAG
jgi:hypothetical protein